MLTLYINSDPEEDFLIALINDNGLVGKSEYNDQLGLSEQLLLLIDELLKTNKFTKAQLTQVAVKVGGGTFSSLRAAIATANGLAYGLNIPVMPIAKNSSLEEVIKTCALTDIKKFQPVMPIYDHEPNITTKRVEL